MMKSIVLIVLLCFLLFGCRSDSEVNNITGNNYISPLNVYVVTSPAEGEIWSSGSTKVIKWSSSENTNPVNISVIKKKAYYETGVVKNLPNNGSYTWYIPPGIPPSVHYQIKISDSKHKDVFGYSEEFNIR